MAKLMNLRSKKENQKPTAVLVDTSNVKNNKNAENIKPTQKKNVFPKTRNVKASMEITHENIENSIIGSPVNREVFKADQSESQLTKLAGNATKKAISSNTVTKKISHRVLTDKTDVNNKIQLNESIVNIAKIAGPSSVLKTKVKDQNKKGKVQASEQDAQIEMPTKRSDSNDEIVKLKPTENQKVTSVIVEKKIIQDAHVKRNALTVQSDKNVRISTPKIGITKNEATVKQVKKRPKPFPKKENTVKTKKSPIECKRSTGKTDCFGFDQSDEEVKPCETELTKFDCSKPYRFALYVQPSRSIRVNMALAQKIQSLNPSLNLTNMSIISNATPARKRSASEMMSPNQSYFKVPFASTPLVVKKPAPKFVQPKITDVIKASPKKTRAGNADRQFKSYFENSSASEEEVTPPPKENRKRKKEESKLENSNDIVEHSIIPVSHLKPSRRSYIKKSKPAPEPEPDDEPPSDELIKSIEKTKKKGKSKKADKEEEEYEKWSRSMNSMFSEVDQFEISFD